MNNDLMNDAKETIIGEVKEHISNKFEIIDRRVDRIHQRLNQLEIPLPVQEVQAPASAATDEEGVDATKAKEVHEEVPKEKDAPKDSYAQKAKNINTKHTNKNQSDMIPEPQRRNDVLIVGTSITNNLDKRVFENFTNLKTDIATAYTIDADIDAKYKDKNFMRIVPEKLKMKKYNTLVLQGGSIEITNLNTRDEDKEENFQLWKKKVESSSNKMFKLAEESISGNPGLEVVIVERIPRFDSTFNDPKQIKSQLSLYANSIYRNLWVEKGCPANIQIHDLGLNCYGALREKRYGIPGTRGFDGKMADGIHMRGILAVKHYTDSFVRMLRPSVANSQAGNGQNRADNHTRCPQTVNLL